MHIDIVPNRGSKPAILLRESYREGGKVKKRTLANLSSLSTDQVESMRLILKGQSLVPVNQIFNIVEVKQHGHVAALLKLVKTLKFDKILGSRSSKHRDLALAMILMRVLDPQSKLATVRTWNHTTLPELLGVEDASELDLYKAIDWLTDRQDKIEKTLAKRHLKDGDLALYDLSSSYFEGRKCPLAKRGYSRDKKKGKLQVNYGLLTNRTGCPVSISAFPGNTPDGATVETAVSKLKSQFGLKSVILVGDRGMISQKKINELKEIEGLEWITALRNQSLRTLIKQSEIQLGLFDERNLFEFESPDYPGERFIACRNPELAARRANTRLALLEATKNDLDKVVKSVEGGRLKGEDKIGVRVGRLINKYKMAKHFELKITETEFSYELNQQKIEAEAALDGIYVIRTSVPADKLDQNEAVEAYKSLSNVEQAFRSMKSIDLQVRPIYHHLEKRVRGHLLICMLAYYLQWHLEKAWKSLLFVEEEKPVRVDPVLPAERSKKTKQKVSRKKLEDGSVTHSLSTLLRHLGQLTRNTCEQDFGKTKKTFTIDSKADEKQAKALELLSTLKV